MTNTQMIVALASLSFLAILAELIFQKQVKSKQRFSWFRYGLFAMYPITMSILMIYGLGIKYLAIFLSSALLGSICEWFLGFYYHRITGEKLWRYKRNNLNEYISLLTLPAWGFAGMLFAFLGQLILDF